MYQKSSQGFSTSFYWEEVALRLMWLVPDSMPLTLNREAWRSPVNIFSPALMIRCYLKSLSRRTTNIYVLLLLWLFMIFCLNYSWIMTLTHNLNWWHEWRSQSTIQQRLCLEYIMNNGLTKHEKQCKWECYQLESMSVIFEYSPPHNESCVSAKEHEPEL